MTIETTSVYDQLVKKAVTLLNAARVQYAIQMPNGSKVGELQTVEVKTKVKAKRGPIKNDWKSITNYPEIMKAMNVGDVADLNIGEDKSASDGRSFYSSLMWGTTLWGRPAADSATARDYIEVAILGKGKFQIMRMK